jgi:hypothetical protein
VSGSVETRPEMTRAQFEAAAAYCYDRWWLTGEDYFIHVPQVMNIDGWNLYGHPGNALLTEPQQVLMMWSDLVGQTSNGGFTQFIDNFGSNLKLAYHLITQLEWPELIDRFDRAFREQAGDPENPVRRQDAWPTFDPRAVDRPLIIGHLARKATRWRPWARRRAEASYAALPDMVLRGLYDRAVDNGEIVPEEPPEFDWDSIVTVEADAFDSWFYRDETKAASKLYIGDYIVRHRAALCRLTD